MDILTYTSLREADNEAYVLRDAPERILQFGEGNFLRGFADYFIDVLNETQGFNSKVVVVQPIANGMVDLLNRQEGLYNLYLRGYEDGQQVNRKRVISCISRGINPYTDCDLFLETAGNPDLRYIVSNTTEAGIVFIRNDRFEDAPASSFPGKLTQLLHQRYKHFGHQPGKGFVVLSCELIDNNGAELKNCVNQYAEHWNLGADFMKWLNDENLFCSTLVDRIVTGYPRNEATKLNEENGYEDMLLNTAEVFGFWVIEGPASLAEELPFSKAGLPVMVVEDQTAYKKRKVRILNGAHTSMVLAAFLAGKNIVRECMDDETILSFMKQTMYEEIIPTLTLPEDELKFFAHSVIERFKNPYIDHELLAISLNSVSKWRARVMPSMKEYVEKYNRLPKLIVFSFAALIAFYSGSVFSDGVLAGYRNGDRYEIKDDGAVLEFFAKNAGPSKYEDLVQKFASNQAFFGEDLSAYEGFVQTVADYLVKIHDNGMQSTLEEVVNG